MSSLKTNNSNLRKKVLLRYLNLPKNNNITVLDLYHGEGEIWENVKRNSSKKINVHGIDIHNYDSKLSLVGDNLKIINNLDLTKYDIIDCDSYGIPDKQIDLCYDKSKSGCIFFYTFIQSFNGCLSNFMLNKIGINSNMIDKCRSIFNKGGHKYFLYFLSCYSIKSVVYYSQGRKFYGCFRKE